MQILRNSDSEERGDDAVRHHSVGGHIPLEEIEKSRWDRLWPVIAGGAGLFSDGYLNNVIASVNPLLAKQYPTEWKESTTARRNITSIVFAGTIVGQLFFGWMSDHVSRKWALLTSTAVLILFAILTTASYGAGGTFNALIMALTAYRFFLGIGIGGEYPAGSVACAEATGELKEGHRHRWFILFTNTQIDLGFVVGAFVPMIVILATTEKHLELAWRLCLGIGILPPLSLLYLRLRLDEPEEYKRENMKETGTPWLLVLRFYWWRLAAISLIWFIYDFSVYSFGLYSTQFLGTILGDDAPLWRNFGWNTLVNLFYIPGCIIGSFICDWVGPRKTLSISLLIQGCIGFLMSGLYGVLSKEENVAGFVVLFGVFLAIGEIGPGNNVGLCSSKSCATAVRGQFYGFAAASGKLGAFVGTYVFPVIQARAPNALRAGQDPFFVSSALCIFSAVLAAVAIPHIGQDTITKEDLRFREYLESNGWNTSKLGFESVREQRDAAIEESSIVEKIGEKN